MPRAVPELPAHIVFESPGVTRLTAPALGALWALVYSFWEGKARPLRRDDATLSVLARCHTRRWYEFRDDVAAAWDELEPVLMSVYAERQNRLANLAQNLMLANAAQAQKRAAKGIDRGFAGADSRRRPAPLIRKEEQPSIPAYLAVSKGELAPKRTLRGQNSAILTDAPR